MKKFIAVLLALLLLTPCAFAAVRHGDQGDAAPVVNYKTYSAGLGQDVVGVGSVAEAIASTTLDADPTAANSGAITTLNADKVAFFVTVDETEVGNSISVAVTLQVSFDNSTWLSASFYDYAGGATLQTSETISADGSYYLWLNKDIVAPYVKLILTATNTDADDTAVVSASVAIRK